LQEEFRSLSLGIGALWTTLNLIQESMTIVLWTESTPQNFIETLWNGVSVCA
jgi:hypothetical protein